MTDTTAVDVDDYMKTSFSQNFCNTVHNLIKYKFPNINGLEVSMDDTGEATIIFDEGEVTAEDVTNYVEEFKKTSPLNLKK